jgi:hypothetical protein
VQVGHPLQPHQRTKEMLQLFIIPLRDVSSSHIHLRNADQTKVIADLTSVILWQTNFSGSCS